MIKLYILRHAESPMDFSVDDKNRPLSAKGKLQAYDVGTHLKDNDIKIDFVACSDATRTKMTLEKLVEAGATIGKTSYYETLYNAPASNVLSVIEKNSDNINSILIVGHNPTMHQITANLSTAGDKELIMKVMYGYSPATLSTIQGESWEELLKNGGELVGLHLSD